MDRQPKRLIEQLQNIQLRQRRVIQQLQAENARLLSDLADVRQERDAFRGKAALARKENVELQNRLEEAMTEYRDLKRGRATLVRFLGTTADARRRSARGSEILNILPVLNEGRNESSPTAEITNTEKAARPKPRPHLHKTLPNPPESDFCSVSTVASQVAIIERRSHDSNQFV